MVVNLASHIIIYTGDGDRCLDFFVFIQVGASTFCEILFLCVIPST